MKFTFLFLCAFFVSGSSFGQFVEKIYLKDSATVYTGWIVEQVPQDYVKILRFKEKDTVLVRSEQIWKIVRIIDTHKLFNSQRPESIKRSNAIFLEGLGNGLFYSLNYDTRFKKGSRDGWGIRAGAGVISGSLVDSADNKKGKVTFTSIPLLLTFLKGKRRSALELGIGSTFIFTKLKGSGNDTFEGVDGEVIRKLINKGSIAITAAAGYRYTSLNNGIIFRAGITPYIFSGSFSMLFGVSLGYHFKGK